MTLAIEQAGSLFTGWFRSCVSCWSLHGEVQHGQRGLEKKEPVVEREMQVCHTQPHLVPPMKLVVYDDLPSPSVNHHRQRSSLSSWMVEGRNLASRASTRASMSWKRQSSTPLKIGAPTDFRRVESFHLESMPALPKQYQPLELSIHRSGHRLSDLPSFEEFQLDDNRQRQNIASPPRAITPPAIRARRCQSSHPTVSISRKPVKEPLYQREHLESPEPVRIASSLIPHFSLVNPVRTTISQQDIHIPFFDGSLSEGNLSPLTTEPSNDTTRSLPDSPPQTPHHNQITDSPYTDSNFTQDSPGTESSRTMPSRISSSAVPQQPRTETQSHRFPYPHYQIPVSLAGENGFSWERTRTLSGSTVGGSTITTITGGANTRKPNVSISSTFTGESTPRASISGPTPAIEIDYDMGFCHPTIFEDRPQHHSYSTSRAEDFPQYDGSNVGLAF
ncbi:hypothetical protein N7450_002458 [Penicillium hetheringtonii]|uniref:Uncharacterized protein n=1 Tax=Penicillium hetheringtonii TaxID=911720 RepID=A0AAD6DWK8_9EURO|nr:hypothetical protein N7450_002458 [Penicillium hetheringtonii]